MDLSSKKYCGFSVSPEFLLLIRGVMHPGRDGQQELKPLFLCCSSPFPPRVVGSRGALSFLIPVGEKEADFGGSYTRWVCYTSHWRVLVWVIQGIHYPVCHRISEQSAKKTLQNIARSLFVHTCSAMMTFCAGFPARLATSRRWTSGFITSSLVVEEKKLISKLPTLAVEFPKATGLHLSFLGQ